MVDAITGSAPRTIRVRVAHAARAMLLVLGAVLALVVVLAGWTQTTSSRHVIAELDLRTLRGALMLHHADGHPLPDSETGLQALVESGHLQRLPIDPWNQPYHYAKSGGLVQIASYGADGVPGGQDNDADLIETFSSTEVAESWAFAACRGGS